MFQDCERDRHFPPVRSKIKHTFNEMKKRFTSTSDFINSHGASIASKDVNLLT